MKWQAFAIVLFAAGADAQPNQAMRDAAHNLEVIMHEQADTLNGFLMRTLAEDPAGRAQLTEMVSRSIETAKAHAADAIHIQTGRECESAIGCQGGAQCSDSRLFRGARLSHRQRAGFATLNADKWMRGSGRRRSPTLLTQDHSSARRCGDEVA